MNKLELRGYLQDNLELSINYLNRALAGEGLEDLREILTRIGRGGNLPHWFETLLKNGTIPNLDGKTVGSIVEMVYVAVLEKYIFHDRQICFYVNPARGIDIPLLDLGIKSPSENFCTSEPFFSAYERILGNEYDALILLTNYQDHKKQTSVRLQIKDFKYLPGSEIADEYICEVARAIRESFEKHQNVSDAKRLIRFIAYSNQSDWLCKELLKIAKLINQDELQINKQVNAALIKYDKDSQKKISKDEEPIPLDYREVLELIQISNLKIDIIVNKLDAWVIDNWGDSAKLPSQNEWNRYLTSNLNGKIGMSFALQWRYNFGKIFKK